MEKLCRACAQPANILIDIFAPIMITKSGNQDTYCSADLLNELTCRYIIIKSSDDALPQYICNICIDSAQSAVNFKRMVEKNNQNYSDEKRGQNEEESEIECEFAEIIRLIKTKANKKEEDLNAFRDMFDKENLMPTKSEEEPLPPEDDKVAIKKTRNKRDLSIYEKKPINCLLSTSSIASASHNQKKTKKRNIKPKTHKCSLCKAKLSTLGNLRIHLRTHTNERPYQCEYCEKCFTQKSHMLAHTRIHTGERPFKCVPCSKSFVQLANLLAHQRTCKAHKRKSTEASKSKRQSK